MMEGVSVIGRPLPRIEPGIGANEQRTAIERESMRINPGMI
jgi:hypothetical protein